MTIGLFAMVIGAVGLMLSEQLGMSADNTIFGVGTGVIAAIVRIGTPLQRLSGFLIGMALGTVLVAMQLGIIPGGANKAGIALSLIVVLVAVAVVHALTARRIQAWSMLLGVLAMSAGVYPALAASPFAAAELFPTAALTQLAMGMIGFLAVLPAQRFPDQTALSAIPQPRNRADADIKKDTTADGTPVVSLDEIIEGSR
ncbi:MAG: hypothetical protein ACJAY5_000440 [Actinomycetes bacterium]|jgi:hypothetical protein